MIAIDTSSLIAFLRGAEGGDVEAVDRALELKQAVLPPVVLTEILSDPKLDRRAARLIQALPRLEIEPGFWERAAGTRAKIFARRRRAPLADTLIAQSCLDHHAPLITRDADFASFSRYAKLRLI